MKINKRVVGKTRNYQGGASRRLNVKEELTRSVLSCLLWENQFYESGKAIADRIKELAIKAPERLVAELAVQARNDMNLRHVPLWLTCALAEKRSKLVEDTLFEVVQRADELTEILAMWWKDGKRPVPAQMKRGLARAFNKFNEYQLAKYNRKGQVKLVDVMRMVHPKPKDADQAAIFKRLREGTLKTPDTWETALSSGADKKATFTRLLTNKKLGYMALLRNLRNMKESGVDPKLVATSILEGNKSRILPFRYLAAAKACPDFEPQLDQAMTAAFGDLDKLPGKTYVLVDVSGSMNWAVADKSDLTRMDAGCALGAIVTGVSDNCEVYSFSQHLKRVPPRQGMAMIDAIRNSQRHLGTWLGKAVKALNKSMKPEDRLIVITDEQSADTVPAPVGKGYMINVASYQHSVDFGSWTKITGFSESVVKYITAMETGNVQTY